MPQIGDTYSPGNEFDAAAIVTDKRISQTAAPTEWEVDITYTSAPLLELTGVDPADVPENPLLAPVEQSLSFVNRRVLVPGRYANPEAAPEDGVYDRDVLAPNGEKFNPQPEMELSEPVVSIKKNFQVVSFAFLSSLANIVNADHFLGAKPRQWRMQAPQASSKWHKLIGTYWTVIFAMQYREDTWGHEDPESGHVLLGWR